MTSEHPESWYVKASFGTEWGPMSFDTMCEMADNGDLTRDDLARCGLDSEWQSVLALIDQRQTPELTANSDETTAQESPEEDELLTVAADETSPAGDTPESPEPPKPAKPRRGVLPNWSSYWNPETSPPQKTVVISRFVAETDDRLSQAVVTGHDSVPDLAAPQFISPTSDDSSNRGDDANRDQPDTNGAFAELETWKRERTERLNRLLEIVAEREAAKQAAETARAAAEAESAAVTERAEPEVDSESAPIPSGSNVTAARVTSHRATIKQESWEETLARWRRSLPDPKVAILLVLVPLAAWWWWPASDAKTAETYREMYFELMELRERPNDKTGMEEFLERSQAQLDRLIPGLEKRASPNQPQLQWLLWMGRDCLRPMLKQPRKADTKPELTFNKLMREWQRWYDPHFESPNDASAETRNATRRPTESPPESSNQDPRDSKTINDGSDSENASKEGSL